MLMVIYMLRGTIVDRHCEIDTALKKYNVVVAL